MQVTYSYYEDEVRDGFYIPGMMKRAWAASIEVLEAVAKICEKHHIQYFADAGTLLGAVRHHGFIPWDDDLDICMKREEYNRFISIAQAELPEGYSLLNIHTEPEYTQMFSRVVNKKQICFEKEHLDKFHGFPFIVGVDIFPLDYIAMDEEQENLRCELVKTVGKVIEGMELLGNSQEAEGLLRQMEELCGVKIDRNGNVKNQLYLLIERLYSIFTEQEASELALMPVWISHEGNKFKKEYYQAAIKVPFENMEISIPAMYDAVLREKYGDYMKLVHNWDYHEYPFYRAQMEALAGKTGFRYPKYVFSMEDLQNPAREAVEKDGHRKRREVVFLPYKASVWDSLESVWRAAKEDPDCDVYVIPVPYYDKKPDGSFGEMHYEADSYPKDVPVMSYEDYNFAERHPDVIFIHNPYDEYNYATSVPPFFYAKNLKQFTDKLVYIPYFVLEEIVPEDKRAVASMEYFVTVPGVVHADKVIVQSENMRQAYIDTLTKFAGEQTKPLWEQKILGLGSPKLDKVKGAGKEELDIPKEWLHILQKKDGGWKKIILYNTSISMLLQYGDRMLDKMRKVFRVFKEKQEEVALLWRPHPLIKSTLESMYTELWEEYQKLVEECMEEDWGIYDDTTDLERAIALCDAYYGDGSSEVQLCRKAGKPVMLQNVDII